MNGATFSAPLKPTGRSFKERYGPCAIVTGASSGIGRAFAVALAARGLDLVVCARDSERLHTLADELRARHGVVASVVAADLGTDDGLAALLDASAALDAGLLVAAAGFGTSGNFLEIDGAAEDAMLALNARATLVLAREYGRRFAARGRGGMILMGSLLGFAGVPFSAHYAATKAYVQSLAEGLHGELRPLGIDVLACAPGPVTSGFAKRAGMKMGAALQPRDVADATLDALGRRSTVVPGALSKVLTYSLDPLPRWARTIVLGRIMRGMTAHREVMTA